MTQGIPGRGEIGQTSGAQVPLIRLPARAALFAARAGRLKQLAPGHAMGDYLGFISLLAEAQREALANMPSTSLPGREHIEQCRAHGMPPLNAQTHPRDRMWREVLRGMLRPLAGQVTGKAREVILDLEGERDELYEAQAVRLLAGITLGLDRARAPLIGAALQVYWVHMVTGLGAEAFGPIGAASVCPACGSRPVASIARAGAGESGLRYLHCSLCSTEWHMVRIKCTSCESTQGIHYQGIEGGTKAVLAESCEACGSYLKMLYLERDPQLEPTADDLASVALDLLMADAGKLRSGQNLMLIQGEEQD